MTSQDIFKKFTALVRERLIKYGHVKISGIGTLRVESAPSASDPVDHRTFVLHPPEKKIVLDASSSSTTDLSLISELASNLRISHEEAAEITRLFSNEILEQIPVTIPEIGSITRSEDSLDFWADPELTAHISGAETNIPPLEIRKTTLAQPVRTRRAQPWVVASLVIVAALVAGSYFILRFIPGPVVPPVSETAETEVPAPVVSPVSATPEDTLENKVPADSQVTEILDDSAVSPPPEQPEDPVPILLDREAGGYTIVLASFMNPNRALATVEQYRTVYPDLPVDTLVSNDNRYRVTIGQVSTLSEAVALKDSLRGLPSSAWPVNILNHNNL